MGRMVVAFIAGGSYPMKKGGASGSYRTATTVYPCYLPVLGESTGAGRKRLAPCEDTIEILACATLRL